MLFEEFFNKIDNPEDVIWIVQDNTVNQQEEVRGCDEFPVFLEGLVIDRCCIYHDGADICICVTCRRV